MPQKLRDQVLTILDRAVSEPATPPSPIAAKRQAIADLNAAISALEVQLGLKHGLPTMSTLRATARLATLEGQLAAKSPAPGATETITPAARPAQLTGDPTTDRAIVAAGVTSLAALKAKSKRDHLFAVACALSPGSTAHACAAANLAKAQAELNESL
jgi:hypothetical protein